jgi:MATE family multidrug resistance protein
MIMSFFLGTVSYVDVFVAQYYGAKQHRLIGPSVWQGMYLSALGALVLLALAPFAPFMFGVVGHAEEIQNNEVIYFQMLCYGAFPALASAAMSGFFAGRGKTWALVLANMFSTAVNVLLDYLLIFGNAGFPRLGIQGAGIATVLASTFTFFLYLALIARPLYNEQYYTLAGWKPNVRLLRRIIRFGLPSGTHFDKKFIINNTKRN